jgi:hypothetical protein
LDKIEVPLEMSDCFVLIDNSLVQQEISIPLRPLIAAMTFVEECMVKIGSDENPTEDYMNKPFFKEIVKITYAWYRQKYGDAMDLYQRERCASWVIVISGSIFNMSIPLYASQKTDKRNQRIVYFPASLLDFEDALDFIVSLSNLDLIDSNEIGIIRKKAEDIVNKIRKVTRDVACAETSGSFTNENVTAMLDDLEKAVNEISRNSLISQSTTPYWEMQMALERMLKLIITQQGDTPSRIHNLDSLYQHAIQKGMKPTRSPYSSLPVLKNAVSYRYGEGISPSHSQVVSDLDTVLDVLYSLSSELKSRKGTIHSGSILLEAPWSNA